jgi:uncharacterized membrane protein YkoI
MNTISTFTLTTLLVLGGAGAAAAQQPSSMDSTQKQVPAYQRTVPDSLLAQVKVSEDSARGLAFTRVPGGSVQGLVLHRERGRLIWTFAIKPAGKPGMVEVNVSALDGRILKVEQRSS